MVRYSHLGLAYQQGDGKGGHVWRVLHKLNHCGTAESAIYRQGLGEFFLDDLWQFEAAWAVPTPTVQAKLLTLLQDDPRALQLHHKPYNMVAYPWALKYQQSNQWAIETLAIAVAPELAGGRATRQQAQSWLQANGYSPARSRLVPPRAWVHACPRPTWPLTTTPITSAAPTRLTPSRWTRSSRG